MQTGTTLRENHLKALPDGVIVESQACLVGNRQALRDNPTVLEAARVMLEHIDGALQGHGFSQVTVNIHGESAEDDRPPDRRQPDHARAARSDRRADSRDGERLAHRDDHHRQRATCSGRSNICAELAGRSASSCPCATIFLEAVADLRAACSRRCALTHTYLIRRGSSACTAMLLDFPRL